MNFIKFRQFLSVTFWAQNVPWPPFLTLLPILGKFDPKHLSWNLLLVLIKVIRTSWWCLFLLLVLLSDLKVDIKTNSSILNWMVVLIFADFDRKRSLLANLAQNIKLFQLKFDSNTILSILNFMVMFIFAVFDSKHSFRKI